MHATIFHRLELAGKLPTPPGVVHRLLEQTRCNKASLQEVAQTISADPVLAAKILRFVNSPLVGMAREISSLQQAVALLGIQSVTALALSLAVMVSDKYPCCSGFDRDQFNVQSLACGVAAQTIAKLTQSIAPHEAFSAGLFSQIGRSVFATAVPDEYSVVIARSQCAPRDLPSLEIAALGESYPILGAHLLRKWGLPESICGAIQLFRDCATTQEFPILARILNCAEIAASIICPQANSPISDAQQFLLVVQRDFGLMQSVGTVALRDIMKEVESLKRILDIPKGHVRKADEIEFDVRERIVEMGIAMHLENKAMADQQADLLRRASTDGMTGIGNRAAFDARVHHEMERAIRSGSPFGLLIIDVDKFKDFNDKYGHQAGDRVLQKVARTLDDNVRKVDFVARYGGEEFAVIAPGTWPDGIRQLGERLRQDVQKAAVPWEGRQLSVTISIGAAGFSDMRDRQDVAGIIRAADEQLYKAKHAGRNQVSCITIP